MQPVQSTRWVLCTIRQRAKHSDAHHTSFERRITSHMLQSSRKIETISTRQKYIASPPQGPPRLPVPLHKIVPRVLYSTHQGSHNYSSSTTSQSTRSIFSARLLFYTKGETQMADRASTPHTALPGRSPLCRLFKTASIGWRVNSGGLCHQSRERCYQQPRTPSLQTGVPHNYFTFFAI